MMTPKLQTPTAAEQRDTLLFYLDALFTAEQAQDTNAYQAALGQLALTMAEIRKDEIYQTTNRRGRTFGDRDS